MSCIAIPQSRNRWLELRRWPKVGHLTQTRPPTLAIRPLARRQRTPILVVHAMSPNDLPPNDATSNARQGVLLQCYISERQYHQGILQLITTLVTVLATYLIATVGVAVHVCPSHKVFKGCAEVPTLVAWFAPAPGIAVVAFLTAMRVWLQASSEYAYQLELELAKYTKIEGKPQVPQLLTLLKANTSRTKRIPMFAFGVTYLLAMAYVIGAGLFLMSWHNATDVAISVVVVLIYLASTAAFSMSRQVAMEDEIQRLSRELYGVPPAKPSVLKSLRAALARTRIPSYRASHQPRRPVATVDATDEAEPLATVQTQKAEATKVGDRQQQPE